MTEASKESGLPTPIEPVIGPPPAEDHADRIHDEYGSFRIGYREGGYPVEETQAGNALGKKKVSSSEGTGVSTGIQPLHDHSIRNKGIPDSERTSSDVPHGADMRDSDYGRRGRFPKQNHNKQSHSKGPLRK